MRCAGFAASRKRSMLWPLPRMGDPLLRLSGGDCESGEVASGQMRFELTAAPDFIFSLAFSPNGRLVAAGSQDGIIRLWRPPGGKPIHWFTGHRSQVTSLAFSADGALLVSGSYDNTALIWDVSQAARTDGPTQSRRPRRPLDRPGQRRRAVGQGDGQAVPRERTARERSRPEQRCPNRLDYQDRRRIGKASGEVDPTGESDGSRSIGNKERSKRSGSATRQCRRSC